MICQTNTTVSALEHRHTCALAIEANTSGGSVCVSTMPLSGYFCFCSEISTVLALTIRVKSPFAYQRHACRFGCMESTVGAGFETTYVPALLAVRARRPEYAVAGWQAVQAGARSRSERLLRPSVRSRPWRLVAVLPSPSVQHR